MKLVSLPRSPLSVGRVGFGCAYLTGGLEVRVGRRLIDAAFDAGIRYFDVAPSYGLGTAEDVLGRALAGRRDRVTVVTKVGIARPVFSLKMQLLRLAAKPLRKWAPSLTRRHGARILGAHAVRGQFALDQVKASVEESFRRLRIDRLDGLLLHEVTASDLGAELLDFLDDLKFRGRVGAIGLATGYDRLNEIPEGVRSRFDIIQYSWSVLDCDQSDPDPSLFHVSHRAIMRALDPLRAWMANDESIRQRLRDVVGRDLDNPVIVGRVLLGAAIAHNPEGITLVGTRQISRIAENASLLEDEDTIDAGRRLAAAIAIEAARPAPV